jgi:predicted O-linked N-acetylglucosamine transferase (SPINDLY family)
MANGLFGFFKPKAAERSPESSLAETLDRARSLYQQGQHADALAICQDILDRHPDHVDALFLAADAAGRKGESERALQGFQKVLDLKPDHAPAHYKRGNLLKDRQQLEAALESYDKAIALDARHAAALCNRGFVLERLERRDAALESYDRAIAIAPGDALAHFNRAGVLRELARQEEAVASYTQAIAVKPDYFEAYCNRGFLLIEMKRWDEALASHAKSIDINPRFAPAHFGRGVVLQHRKEWHAALASYDRVIEIDPGHASAHCSRGGLLMELKQWSAARSSLERAIALKPDFAEAYCSIANLWATVGQSEVALTNFDRAIALDADYAKAHLGRAGVLVEMKRFSLAIESIDRGIALEADSGFVLGARHLAKMCICDWSDFPADVNRLAAGLEAGETVSPPHQALSLVDSARLQYKAAQIWVREVHPPNPELPRISRRLRPEKARIGYFSGEFFLHPVTILMAAVFEGHDRSRYEVIGFSYGPHAQDEFGMRLQRGVDRFIDVRGKSDRDVALLAREMEIDIAVDLAGHTGRSRTGILALRAAPLQVNYLGYAGTMAADYMDYLIADGTVIPEGYESYYAEKIVRLPNSFMPNDSSRVVASTVHTRDELGLPTTGFVFCCFNNSYKITPDVFDSWMRILARVPNSVLWLSRHNETVVENLRRETLRRGVAAERLIFAKHMPSWAEHLARHRAADLFLDTRPYNAHATAMDALWAGLPVLTLPGEGFASRVAASLLNAVGLPELVATSGANYEDMAVNMAENPGIVAGAREKLARNRLDSPLFDTPRFVKDLESGYAQMLDRLRAGLPPEHMNVIGV